MAGLVALWAGLQWGKAPGARCQPARLLTPPPKPQLAQTQPSSTDGSQFQDQGAGGLCFISQDEATSQGSAAVQGSLLPFGPQKHSPRRPASAAVLGVTWQSPTSRSAQAIRVLLEMNRV